MLLHDEVVWVYKVLLNREPESERVINEAIANHTDIASLSESVKGSAEFSRLNNEKSPFWHYSTTIDAIDIIKSHAVDGLVASKAHLVNFLGVKIRPEFFPSIIADRIGTVEGIPIPANWHADVAEWASCLNAVDAAGEQFTMLELGCGWGCWMTNLGVAAKSAGKKVKLYGIEADAQHLEYAQKAFSDNGITGEEFVLAPGIAGKKGSVALFPYIESGVDWGGTALFNPTQALMDESLKSGKYIQMPIVDIANLIADEKMLDLLHVDIQGAELELLSEMFDLLCKKVKRVFIGTHSKQIEGGLFDLFFSKGDWVLEMERPAIFNIQAGIPIIQCDGVQTWKNKRLA